MFNVDGKEFVFLVLIALVVLGPEKLPDLFRRAGKAYSEFRRLSDGFQEEFRRAVEEPVTEMKATGTLIRESVDLRTTVTSDPGDDQRADHELEDYEVDDLIDDLPVVDIDPAGHQISTADRSTGDDRPERTEDESAATVDAGATSTEQIDPRVHQVELPNFSGESGFDDDRHANESGRATEPIEAVETIEAVNTVESVDFEFVQAVSADDPTATDPTDRGRVNGDGDGRQTSDRESTGRESVDAHVTDQTIQNGAGDDLDRRA